MCIVTDVYDTIEKYGKLTKPDDVVIKKLLATDIQCNQCKYKPKNMPDLKNHLIEHKQTTATTTVI